MKQPFRESLVFQMTMTTAVNALQLNRLFAFQWTQGLPDD